MPRGQVIASKRIFDENGVLVVATGQPIPDEYLHLANEPTPKTSGKKRSARTRAKSAATRSKRKTR